MALFVNTNLASINAQRHLETNQASLRTSLERLSSGVRINDAYDDAAGLAIADKLQRDSRVTAQAIRNANDGLSALSIAEKTLSTVTSIVTRLTELASQSATGTINNTQRSAIQNEFRELLSEIDRIAKTTTFNGVSLLSGGQNLTLQVGLDGATTSRITVTTVDAQLSTLGIEASFRLVDPVQYRARLDDFDFDMTIERFSMASTPGGDRDGRLQPRHPGRVREPAPVGDRQRPRRPRAVHRRRGPHPRRGRGRRDGEPHPREHPPAGRRRRPGAGQPGPGARAPASRVGEARRHTRGRGSPRSPAPPGAEDRWQG